MDVLKSSRAAVGMRDHGRYDYNLSFPVIQTATVELKSSGSISTVNEFPAFMGMTGYGVDHGMLADICDIVHGISTPLHIGNRLFSACILTDNPQEINDDFPS